MSFAERRRARKRTIKGDNSVVELAETKPAPLRPLKPLKSAPKKPLAPLKMPRKTEEEDGSVDVAKSESSASLSSSSGGAPTGGASALAARLSQLDLDEDAAREEEKEAKATESKNGKEEEDEEKTKAERAEAREKQAESRKKKSAQTFMEDQRKIFESADEPIDKDRKTYWDYTERSDFREALATLFDCFRNNGLWLNAKLSLQRWFNRRAQATRAHEILAKEMEKVVIPKPLKELSEAEMRAALSHVCPRPSGDPSDLSGPPVLHLTVRRSDELRRDALLKHPVVRFSVLDGLTGVLKRAEGGEEKAILPLLSDPYDLRGSGRMMAKWEQKFLVSQQFSSFFTTETLFILELLDFSPTLDFDRHPDGFVHIAWAFLRPLSADGTPNVGKIRLQLFEHSATVRKPLVPRPGVPDVYFEWVFQKNVGWKRYPSTLHCVLEGVSAPPSRTVKGRRPVLLTDREEGRLPFEKMKRRVQKFEI
eukprot:28973_1